MSFCVSSLLPFILTMFLLRRYDPSGNLPAGLQAQINNNAAREDTTLLFTFQTYIKSFDFTSAYRYFLSFSLFKKMYICTSLSG